jgi:hypothetical protein
MRQVPVLDAGPIGIVGDGSVARHFLHDLSLLGLSVCAWSRRAPAAGRRKLSPPAAPSFSSFAIRRLSPCPPCRRVARSAGKTPGHEFYDLATYCRIPFILDSGGTPFHGIYHAFVRVYEQRS